METVPEQSATVTPVEPTVHQLKVTLQEISPPIWRRIHLYSHTPLSGLHAVIQVAMGWDDSHLWELAARYERNYGSQAGNPDAVTVADVLPEVGRGAGYVYDFGDHWVHGITVEKIHRPAKNTHYPRCSAGNRACPPEDCGGPEGYYNLLRVKRHRKGWKYQQLREWGLHKYDPAAFDRDEVNRQLSDDPKACRYHLPAPWQREVVVSPPRRPLTPADTGQVVDHQQSGPHDELQESESAAEVVNALTTDLPSVAEAADAVLDALDKVDEARALLGAALRAEQKASGATANQLAERVRGAMSRPLVLKALKDRD